MAVVLSHISALQYHRAYRVSGFGSFAPEAKRLDRYAALKALSGVPNKAEVRETLDYYSGCLKDPLHVLVNGDRARRKDDRAVYHVMPKAVPLTSFIKVGPGVFCCGPELMLSQCASLLDRASLALAVMEFCGAYKTDPEFATILPAQPATSVGRISGFAHRYSQVRGCNQLSKTCAYTADGAASPMESALFLLLVFPVQWGGFGLPRPQLNYRIDIPYSLQRISGKTCFYGDLVWPSNKLIVEYDSDQFHVGHERISQDAVRRNILSSLGYTVITATSDQVYSSSKTEELARQVGKGVGKRFRPNKHNYAAERQKLRNTLLYGPAC